MQQVLGRPRSRNSLTSICRSIRVVSPRCARRLCLSRRRLSFKPMRTISAARSLRTDPCEFGSGANRSDVNRFTFNRRFRPEEMIIPEKAQRLFPALANVKLMGGWAGIRECTPDMMPNSRARGRAGGISRLCGLQRARILPRAMRRRIDGRMDYRRCSVHGLRSILLAPVHAPGRAAISPQGRHRADWMRCR